MSEPKAKSVLVTGDYVLDHHIYEGQRHHFGDRRHRGVQEKEELGGAALVHYLLAELKGGVESFLSVSIDASRSPVLPKGVTPSGALSAYAVWKPFDREGGKSPENRVWRTENAMGFGGEAEPDVDASAVWTSAPGLPEAPDVVVLSDGGMGFRAHEKRWPAKTVLSRARWIVLKTADPLVEGPLWERLTQPEHREKLVVIVSSTELRKSLARISTGLSWDATAESAIEATASGGELEELSHCRHLLLVFGTEGGLWIDFDKAPAGARAHLVYDADSIEGEHRPGSQGTAFGALSCIAAAAAWHLARGGETPDLEAALEGGLSAAYDLFDQGHGRAAVPGAGFPAKRLAAAVQEASCRYARTAFYVAQVLAASDCPAGNAPQPGERCWSILREALCQQGVRCPEPAWNLAERVATRGPIAVGSLPHLSIGKLMSADRREIESLRGLRRLIVDYKAKKSCKRPLSIGVFGPPGAGKSFAVKEIAQTFIGKEEWMEFNLSQFKSGTEDLIGAFHQIRDRALRNQIPVAFFDEFDSREYAWLQYLLAPMQDGAFQEGQITHPIGKCIFVFAGGTSWTFDSFGPAPWKEDAYARFKMAKGPDFKSRLDGFLDVLSPNQRVIVRIAEDEKRGKDGKSGGKRKDEEVEKDENGYERVLDPCDIFYPARRAFVIRAEFGCAPADKLAIDGGLLNALLRAKDYANGARSLSKVLEPLKAARPGRIYRSLLAPRQQLALNVEADQFLRDMRAYRPSAPPSPSWDRAARERVAAAIHETWRKLGKEQGWLDSKDDVGFDKLRPFLQESNRAAAIRMARVLALIGLALEPGANADGELEPLRLKIEYNLELLAEAEHEGWMEWYLDQGWQCGSKKSEQEKTHPCLKPYIQLSAREQNKDRESIRHYIEFARTALMKIVVRGD